MPKAVMSAGLGLLLILLAGWSGLAAHENSGALSVPLSEVWQVYSQIKNYQFVVRECGFIEFQGQFATGDLAEASRRAAAAWQQAFPSVQISIGTAPCEFGANAFRNSQNEIYWDDRPGDSAEVGDYMAYVQLNGVLLEHDITVEPVELGDFSDDFQTDRHVALYNLMLHELGHALGLNDAYLIDLDGCDWSVMLKLCPGGQHDPQPADVAALQHIYGLSPQPSNITPQPAPAPTPVPPVSPPQSSSSVLQRFDLDHSGYIDDSELFYAVDLWTMGELSDDQFYQVTDAWIRQVHVAALKRRIGSSALSAIAIYDASGQPVTNVACGPGDVNARTGQALRQTGSPAGLYISVVRDCDSSRTRVVQGLFPGR